MPIPCSSKYPPKPSAGKPGKMPDQNADGSMQVIFGRNMGLVYPPTTWKMKPQDARPPDRILKRQHVHGYNGEIMNGIHFLSENEVMYPIAGLVVVQSLTDGTQKYFEGHNSDVLCVSWSARRRLAASGQGDPQGIGGPYVCVWAPDKNYITETIAELHGHAREVSACAFSSDGRTLVTFGCDDGNTIMIWRDFASWDGKTGPPIGAFGDRSGPSRPQALHSVSSGRMKTMAVYPNPEDRDTTIMTFFSIGEKHFKFWTITMKKGQEPDVSQKRGTFGKCPVPNNPTGICFAGGGVSWLTGDNGHIYIVASSSAAMDKRLVARGVSVGLGCIGLLPDGRFIAGCSDGQIFIGTAAPTPVVEERLSLADKQGAQTLQGQEGRLLASTAPAPWTNLCVCNHLVLMGTANHALVLIDLDQKMVLRVLTVSHTGESWAMDHHPELALCATGSNARDIRFWNIADKRPAVGKVLRTEFPVYSLSFEPSGRLLAAGFGNGYIMIYGFPSLQVGYRQRVSAGAERICDLVFSPNSLYLGAACWDQMVYLLLVTPDAESSGVAMAKLHRVLKGNSSSPICILFTRDSQYIMSNSKDVQILFWKCKDGSRQQSIAFFRDAVWQNNWSCQLGWPVVGIWNDPDYDQTDINSVCQSSPPLDRFIAIGDDKSMVKLFRYPNPFLDPPCFTYSGHSAHVTRVRFSPEGHGARQILTSIGGSDRSLMQWSLEKVEAENFVPSRVMHPWQSVEGASEMGHPGGGRFDDSFIGRSRQNIREENRIQNAAGAAALPSQMPSGFAPPARSKPNERPGSVPAGGRRPSSDAGSQARSGAGSQRAPSAGAGGRSGRHYYRNQSHGVGGSMKWD